MNNKKAICVIDYIHKITMNKYTVLLLNLTLYGMNYLEYYNKT